MEAAPGARAFLSLSLARQLRRAPVTLVLCSCLVLSGEGQGGRLLLIKLETGQK